MHDRAPDFWRRSKRLRSHIEQLFYLTICFEENGKIATFARSGCGSDAIDNLALEHQGHVGEAVALLDQSLQNCRSDVVGKISDYARLLRRLNRAAEINRQGIGFD